MKHRLKANPSAMIHGGNAAPWQLDFTAALQFKKQCTAGHVLEPTGRITPLPSFGNFA
jgi:hypothetical protein